MAVLAKSHYIQKARGCITLSLDKRGGKGTPHDRAFMATPLPKYTPHTKCTKIYHTTN